MGFGSSVGNSQIKCQKRLAASPLLPNKIEKWFGEDCLFLERLKGLLAELAGFILDTNHAAYSVLSLPRTCRLTAKVSGGK
jgi:hypothetical protein